jgi:xanthine dehydrogenase molybdopterin-binding subunit B
MTSGQSISEDSFKGRLIRLAKQDLAGRMGFHIDEIDFVDFESVIWPDGSLGCPKLGVAYTQVQQEGYLIHLRYAGQIFSYHGGGEITPFLCE